MKFDQKGEKYLTYEEFAEERGVKPATVRQWAHRGIIMIRYFGLRPYIWEKEEVLHSPIGRPRNEYRRPKL